MPLISIIVPIYNAANYLHKCINSILNQSLNDLEIILIDDGSNDGSSLICDFFQKKDNRIKVVHNRNQGISASRELGLQLAKGEYILFVDSDDWIDNNMLSHMYKIAKQEHLDIVGCTFYAVYADHKKLIRTFYAKYEDFLSDIIRGNWGVVWKLLTKKSLYKQNNIHFPTNINGGEDYVVCVKLLSSTYKVKCLDQPYYYYNKTNINSLMSSLTLEKINDQIKATQLVENYLKATGKFYKYQQELNIRKFKSKLPLLKINPLQWSEIFPESNYIYKTKLINLNWKINFFIRLILFFKRS